MNNQKSNSTVRLTYGNWHPWDRYVKSTIRWKNAYITFDPKPINPCTQQQIVPAATTATPSVTVIPLPTPEEMKVYREELKEWKTANNVAAGVILGAIPDEVQHVINPEDSVKDMYDKLKTEILKQSSGSSANGTQIELVYKQFKDTPTMDNFKKHITFYHSKNADLIAFGAGFNDSFLAWLLLNLFSSNEDQIWSIASTNIVTLDTPINQWLFNHITGKLHETLRNNICPTDASTSGNNQMALNATASKTSSNCYNGPLCTYPGCHRPKTHPIDKCWTKERESRNKGNEKKYRAKKAKKKVIESSSDSESGSDSSDSDSELPQKKRHHANRMQARSRMTLQVLKATVDHTRSYQGKANNQGVFVAHPDLGASNHMTHQLDIFDTSSFETLSKPIPISLGDDLEIFATGKGTIRLMFNIDGKRKEGEFSNVLYVPEPKVTLLSIRQSAWLPHCRVVFDDNVCEYIDKNMNEVITCAHTSNDTDLYTLDAIPIVQKVAAKLTSSSS